MTLFWRRCDVSTTSFESCACWVCAMEPLLSGILHKNWFTNVLVGSCLIYTYNEVCLAMIMMHIFIWVANGPEIWKIKGKAMLRNLNNQIPLPTKNKSHFPLKTKGSEVQAQIDKRSQNVSTETWIKQLFPKQAVIQLPWLKTAVTSILSYFLF